MTLHSLYRTELEIWTDRQREACLAPTPIHSMEAGAFDIPFRIRKNRGAAWQSHLLLNGQNRIRMWVVSPRSRWWQFWCKKLKVAQVCEAGGVRKRKHAGIPPHDYSRLHQLLPPVIPLAVLAYFTAG